MPDKSRFSSPNLGRSRELRRKQTKAECFAWYVLRDRRTLGFKFRRQVPTDEFIVDFYCDELRLVIEIDGDVHGKAGQHVRDMMRDERLAELGYTVLRIPNGMAINDPDSLREMIRSLRRSPGASRHPLPEGEGHE
jgi:very-short-patch-repair endonuclease